jgi:hypothetical protein
MGPEAIDKILVSTGWPQAHNFSSFSTLMSATPASFLVSNMANARNTPHSNDFLQKFSLAVPTAITDYHKAKIKLDKTVVLGAIVDKVQSLRDPKTGKPARFVKYSKQTGWVQIGKDSAREKVGHAMREAVMANEPLSLSDEDC